MAYGVLDGQAVNAAVTNAAFIVKNADDTTLNKLGLNRAGSGTSIADIQAAVNRLYTATGASEIATGTVYNATPNTINNGDPYQTALTELAGKFDPATGHYHTGSAGDGPMIAGSSITSVPLSQFIELGGVISATGGSNIVTSSLIGKSVSTSFNEEGVITNFPQNYVSLYNASSGNFNQPILNVSMHPVFGRLTSASGDFILSYFSFISGAETAYTFSSPTQVGWYYRELFEPLVTTPVYEPTLEAIDRILAGAASGVNTIQPGTGGSPLTGDIILSAGPGINIAATGNVIEISNTGSGSGNPIVARAILSSNATVTGLSPVNFDLIDYDPFNTITTGASWKFTSPASGYLNILITSYSTTTGVGNQIYKNGVGYGYVNTNNNLVQAGSVQMQIGTGDEVYFAPDSTSNFVGTTSNPFTFISFELIN